MLQSLIPKLMTEIADYDKEYQPPLPRTNVSQTLMTQPAATIRAPVGFDPVPEKKMLVGKRIPILPIPAALLKQNNGKIDAAAFMPKRRVKAEQVGVLLFKNLEEYKDFLTVGKHLIHSSP